MLRFAVVGNPVSHSKSPLIHSLFAEQTGQLLEYAREEVPLDGFDVFVNRFFAGGGSGLNVTVPFKEPAFQMAQVHSERATMARAVNTLYRDDRDRLVGDNTDGIGLIRDLRDNHKIKIANTRLLVVGAGGAVRGVLANLIEQGPQSITLVNRTVARANTLQQDFASLADIEVVAFTDQPERPYDLIINGTSSGLQNQAPPLEPDTVGSRTCCYDMMYGRDDTPFMTWSRQQEAGEVLDGLGMLVEQAAESFAVWLRIQPETAGVIEQVRASLK